MKKKKEMKSRKGLPIRREDDYHRPHFYGDYIDRYGVRRNTSCRGCPFDGQCTTCLED